RRPDPQIRAVLLFGPDAGLVRERADTLARAICPDLHDPFRVAELTATIVAADPARLADEAAQISLIDGRRVVRMRDAGDALVIAEAGDLPGRSALRRAFDEAPQGVAIGCYPDNARDLAAVIRDTF